MRRRAALGKINRGDICARGRVAWQIGGVNRVLGLFGPVYRDESGVVASHGQQPCPETAGHKDSPMDDRDPFTMMRIPSAARPLLGITVLLVEDSRYASEAMRLLCMRSGARIRRADCLRSARRHLQVYRPSVLIVDLGLPDGSGLDLIAETHQASPRISTILGISADDDGQARCEAAGADGFLAKPLQSLAFFQQEVLRHLPAEMQRSGPQILQDQVIHPDFIAYRDDIAHIADLLDGPGDDAVVSYVTQFLEGVASMAGDNALLVATRALRAAQDQRRPLRADLAHLAGVLQSRLAERVAI